MQSETIFLIPYAKRKLESRIGIANKAFELLSDRIISSSRYVRPYKHFHPNDFTFFRETGYSSLTQVSFVGDFFSYFRKQIFGMYYTAGLTPLGGIDEEIEKGVFVFNPKFESLVLEYLKENRSIKSKETTKIKKDMILPFVILE